MYTTAHKTRSIGQHHTSDQLRPGGGNEQPNIGPKPAPQYGHGTNLGQNSVYVAYQNFRGVPTTDWHCGVSVASEIESQHWATPLHEIGHRFRSALTESVEQQQGSTLTFAESMQSQINPVMPED
jgi:hypothetical protein